MWERKKKPSKELIVYIFDAFIKGKMMFEIISKKINDEESKIFIFFLQFL